MKKLGAMAAIALLAACGGSSSKDGGGTPNPGEPNDTIATATQFTLGTPVVATISSSTDYDYYKFTVPAGGATLNIQTFDSGGTSCDLAADTVDPYVEVFDGSGTYVMSSDDSGINWCEDFNVTLAEGINYVAISGYPPYPFVYTLKIHVL